MTFKSLLFSIARAIAVYKSIFKSLLKRSFCSLISCIFAKSSSADFKKSSDVIGSGFLFAQETIIPRDKTNNIFNKYLILGSCGS